MCIVCSVIKSAPATTITQMWKELILCWSHPSEKVVFCTKFYKYLTHIYRYLWLYSFPHRLWAFVWRCTEARSWSDRMLLASQPPHPQLQRTQPAHQHQQYHLHHYLPHQPHQCCIPEALWSVLCIIHASLKNKIRRSVINRRDYTCEINKPQDAGKLRGWTCRWEDISNRCEGPRQKKAKISFNLKITSHHSQKREILDKILWI